MDVPTHILDAVRDAELESALRREVSMSSLRQREPRYAGHLSSAHSSAEDVSTTSDSDREPDYQTDFTTPATSDSYQEDNQPDDVEDFRDREYPQLKGKVYLDHGGTTLYAKSLIEEFSADMISNLYGNPHSASTPSAIAGHRVDQIRERALRFFNADPDHFDLVFTANATASIKLVIECFKDHAAASNTPVWYGYHRDAHSSIVGVREATKMHRCFTSDEEVDIWINSGGLGGPRARQLGLFAYPGQSNMTGRRLPLSWPGRIRKSMHKAATYTLLDAAALASTAPLDLSDPATAPDFVALSFYKIFGFPNIGALIVRKESAHALESRKYFGGGTVEMVISINDTWHAKKDTTLHDRLEDGTLPFHSIFALDHAMNVHERLYGHNPMKFISHHTAQLGKQLYDQLSSLRHANGQPLCIIYKDENAIYGDPSLQGSTVAFNVMRPDGSLLGFADVEEAADSRNIYVRSGSLCNPGGVATYLGWSPAEMRAAYAAGHRCSNPKQIMLGKATGVVRVSLGAMSTASDVQTLIRFLEEVYVVPAAPVAPTRKASLPQLNTQVLPTSNPAYAGVLTPTTAVEDGEAAAKPQDTDAVAAPPVPTLPLSPPPSATTPADAEKSAPFRSPAFVPSDYVKRRRPWEEEMRKHSATPFTHSEIKSRYGGEYDDAVSGKPGTTPSFRARKFGRSMVNLLKNKSQPAVSYNFADQQPHQRDAKSLAAAAAAAIAAVDPPLQLPPTLHADNKSQASSRRSFERQQFAANMKALGL